MCLNISVIVIVVAVVVIWEDDVDSDDYDEIQQLHDKPDLWSFEWKAGMNEHLW